MSRLDAVDLELFAYRFASTAENMGEVLRRTSMSTNVKQRLDFSCGVLDADGRLVANAPHVPVHLGALGVCVRAVDEVLSLGPGDVGLTNHPAFGGSHLPDVTVVTPVFDPISGVRIGFVANRAHHAEIGGKQPGSMPPDARNLEEEGVVLAPMKVVDGGRSNLETLEGLLSSGRFPSRQVGQNLADVRAAIAANRQGVVDLQTLAQESSAATVTRRMQQILERSSRRCRALLRERVKERCSAIESLDDGTPLSVAIGWIEGTKSRLQFDFRGSGGVHSRCLNAPSAIARAAVLYVLQLLAGARLPLNEGLFEPVEILLEEGILSPHFPPLVSDCPAVGGGNVETSQRLVDTLMKALGLAAASQGTMNNTVFGNQHFGYYETLSGGSGATADRAGASGVQTHMTNTAITDPEWLELEFPVRLERFCLRRGSGGKGLHSGGDGVIREFRFLEPVTASVLAERRLSGPYGLAGGEPGKSGRNYVVRTNGDSEPLGSEAPVELQAGDRLVVETPGGGGWGGPVEAERKSR